MSLCRQQSCATGPSFEDMVAQLEEVKLSQRETKEMAQDISGSLDEAMKALVEENKKLKKENKKLKEGNEELKERVSEWKEVMGEYAGHDDPWPSLVGEWICDLTNGFEEDIEKLQERVDEMEEENEKLKEEMNSKLQDATMWENEDLETQARRWRMVAIGADEYAEKLKEEISAWKDVFMNYAGGDIGGDLNPEAFADYLRARMKWQDEDEQKLTDEISELEARLEDQAEEIDEWKERLSCYEGTEEDATPDVMSSYLESKTDEIVELHDEISELEARLEDQAKEKDEEIEKLKEKLLNIQETCVGDGLEYLVEDK